MNDLRHLLTRIQDEGDAKANALATRAIEVLDAEPITDRFDPFLGVSEQARAVMAMIEAQGEWEIPVGTMLISRAWYNGREGGIALVVEAQTENGHERLVCVFGECRGSDQIFFDKWIDQGKGSTFYTPLDSNAEGYEEAYANRKHYNCGDAGKAADDIINEISEFLDRALDFFRAGSGSSAATA